MILLIGRDGTLQDAQRQVGSRLLDGDLLQLGGHFLVGLDVLREAVDARGGEQLQTTLRQLVLQDRRSAEQRALLVEQLVDRLDDEHGIRQVLHFGDHVLEAVLYLTLVLGVTTEGGGIELISHCPTQEARHMVGSQLANEAVQQRGLTDTGLTRNQQVGLGLTTEYLVNDGDFLLKSDDVVQIAGTCDGGLVHAVLGQTALATSGRGLLRQLGALHIGSLHVRAATHLRTDVGWCQRQGLQLVEREAYARSHQGGQHTDVGALLEVELHLIVLSLVEHGLSLGTVLQVTHRTNGTRSQLHLHVSPVLEIEVILVQI